MKWYISALNKFRLFLVIVFLKVKIDKLRLKCLNSYLKVTFSPSKGEPFNKVQYACMMFKTLHLLLHY